ncbi:AP-3 complex subunit sigma-1-like [Sminthopsis crassicaudata]|uniref:AP-3 complex subunit sigma-1-like n=1 Tax=Sminthopsis crassicaudata TaxID=9301 RepID=UPI003D695F67
MLKAMIFIFNNQWELQFSQFYKPYVFMETLNKFFENVYELDFIFHVDKVHDILAEMLMEVMVLETNMNIIVTQTDVQNKLEKSDTGLAGPSAQGVSILRNMNLPDIPRNNKLVTLA